jgi:hypothetical protein
MRNSFNCRHLLALAALSAATWMVPGAALAQGVAWRDEALRIEAVRIQISNPSTSSAENQRIEDQARRTLSMFPGDRFSQEAFDFMISRVRRSASLSDAQYTLDFGPSGGVIVMVELTLKPATPADEGATGGSDAVFPRSVRFRWRIREDETGPVRPSLQQHQRLVRTPGSDAERQSAGRRHAVG